MSVLFSPWGNQQFFDENGDPATGWKIYTYAAGSSTPLATYTDSTGTVAQSAAIILNALGFPTNGQIWLASGSSYKFILTDANGIEKKTEDYIVGVSSASSAIGQWQPSSVTPTYVSATSFTVSGDQTNEFHVGRRLQFTTTAGTVYGTILASVYTTLTTVTVEMDNGLALDSGLSVANLSILRADKLALPSNKQNSGSRVIGLTGNVNASTPLTKFDLAANGAVFRDANGWTYAIESSISTKTCDLGLAGPAANGRDQSAAFTASSSIYLYLIYDPSTNTIGTLASTTAPTSFTGSTLPSGYTMWAYATTLRWNASSNIIPGFVRGSLYEYDVAVSGVIRVLTAGIATSMTAVSLSGLVPTNALLAHCQFTLALVHNAAAVQFDFLVRTTGSSIAGSAVASVVSVAAGTGAAVISRDYVALNGSQQIDYKLNLAPASGGGAYIDVLGYTVPNGDA